MLERQDLLSLEEYAEKRSSIRHKTIQVKKLREVHLGNHIRMIFENKQEENIKKLAKLLMKT